MLYGKAQTITQVTVQSMDRRVLRRSPSDTLKRTTNETLPKAESGRPCSRFAGKIATEFGEMRTPLTGPDTILHINIVHGNHFFVNRGGPIGTYR